MTTKIRNGLSYEKGGWTYISIRGAPKEREDMRMGIFAHTILRKSKKH